jgi:alkaline phosphatase D
MFNKLNPWHLLLNSPISRRNLLRGGANLTAALVLGGLPSLLHGATKRLSRLQADPFYLGIASGDPTSDSVVLWTRLAREVMTAANAALDAVDVDYEIADSRAFSNILRSGSIAATPELGHSAHAEVRGLDPDTEYFYRWHIGGITSPVGRTKTAPAANANNQEFRFAIASCRGI